MSVEDDTGTDAAPEAIGVLLGGELRPLVSASVTNLRVKVGAAVCPTAPFVVRLVSTKAEETFSIELDVIAVASPTPLETELTINARQPQVWSAALASFRGAAQPELGALLPMTRPRPAPPVGLKYISPAIRAGYVAIGAVILICGSIVASDLYSRVFVATPETALVAVDILTLASPANGRVVFVNNRTSVAAGEPILGVAQRSGRDLAIESPCDCDVVGRPISIGNLVHRGDPALLLAAPGKKPYVAASVDRATLFRLARGASVTLSYGDGVVITRPLGAVEIADPLDQDPASDSVRLKLDPGREIDRASLGAPVKVSFDTFRGTAFVRLFRGAPAPGATRLAATTAGDREATTDVLN